MRDKPLALVTGFEPFGGDSLNPTALLAERLNGQSVRGVEVRGVVLPVELGRLSHELECHLGGALPVAILSFGLAAGRAAISLERTAVNVLDFRIPDNAGTQVRDQEIVVGGPLAYGSRLPLREAVECLRSSGIPAYISDTAGLYLCNAWMYLVLHHLSTHNMDIPAGFVHVPYLPEQAALQDEPRPSMSLEMLTQAACLLLETTIGPLAR